MLYCIPQLKTNSIKFTHAHKEVRMFCNQCEQTAKGTGAWRIPVEIKTKTTKVVIFATDLANNRSAKTSVTITRK